MSMAGLTGSGAAKRRRDRQLRAFHRHEMLSVKMALATALHHSAQRVEVPREGVEGEENDAPRRQKPPPPGTRPGVLVDPGPALALVRHSGKQLIDDLPSVQILDAPMPQMAGTVLEFFRSLDLPVDEQVITVPKFSPERVPQRLVERRFPQLAEQLVEVPTVLSYSLLQQRNAAQQKKEEEELEAARRQLLSLLAVPPPLRTAEQLSRIQDCNGVIRRQGERKRGRRKNFLGLLVLVVVVPVLDSDKFQQSKLYMFLKAPQLQFIDRVLDILVLRAETCTHSANCAEDCRVSTGAVLGQCLRLTSVVSASVRHPTLTRSTPSTS